MYVSYSPFFQVSRILDNLITKIIKINFFLLIKISNFGRYMKLIYIIL